MSASFTTAGNYNGRAKSWSLVLLACVICNLVLAATAEGATFRDEFDAIAYTGNNGSSNWTGDWIEVGEADGPVTRSLAGAGLGCRKNIASFKDVGNGLLLDRGCLEVTLFLDRTQQFGRQAELIK